ncbi:uncharacterized protein LOC123663253 [Melitaea cinxia]|uniref:uncharacterized protein LOC123663253 n=1 Tax=Melitaea cinxia TaxID=113334 RepID=UPI001E27097C|nr:uncharacterized protein LOC123663253 [Melitaea cinxia]
MKVIAFTETWLNCNINNSELMDSRYVIYRRDRVITSTSKQDGGGVLLAVSKELQSRRMPDWESAGEDLWVVVDVDICGKSEKLALCVVYLPPTSSTQMKLKTLSDFLNSASRVLLKMNKVVICGNFNLSFIDWVFDKDTLQIIPSNYNNSIGTAFVDFMLTNSLNQICAVRNCDDRILDLVLTNISGGSVVQSSDLLSKLDPFHPSFEITFSLSPTCFLRPVLGDYRSFYKANYDRIWQHLGKIDWSERFSHCDDVDSMTLSFYNELYSVIDANVPLTTMKKSRHRPPWYTNALVGMLTEKEKIRKRRMEESIQKNPKTFWRYINKKRNGDNSVPSVMYSGSESVNSGQSIAQLLADHFSLACSDSQPVLPLSVESSFSNILSFGNMSSLQFTVEQVEKGLGSLKPSGGAGPDKVPPVFLIRCASVLALPLQLIYNRSISDGRFPVEWKRARIVPVHKKGDIHDVKNYCPISILSCVSKLFEQLIRPVLTCFVRPYISTYQHGFIRGRSTMTNLVEFVADVMTGVDRGHQIDAIDTDFSSAFDRVRDLGVVIDSKLKFDIHVDSVTCKAARMLGFVKRNAGDFRLPSTKILLFNCLVRSHLEYGSVVWSPSYVVHSQRLEGIQRAFTRYLAFTSPGISHRSSYDQRLDHFGLITLRDRRKLLDLLFLYKVINGFMDSTDILSRVNLCVPYNSPRKPISHIFECSRNRTNLGRHSPINRICVEYGELCSRAPDVDIFSDSLRKFKNQILKSIAGCN